MGRGKSLQRCCACNRLYNKKDIGINGLCPGCRRGNRVLSFDKYNKKNFKKVRYDRRSKRKA